MKQQTKRWILAAVFLVAICVAAALIIQNRPSQFNGSRVKNPDAYLLDFTSMQQDDSHSLYLAANDVLQVEFGINRGEVNVQIGIEGEEPIYRGSKVDTANFELPISQPGDYVIAIEAHGAEGFLHFNKKEASADAGSEE